MARIIKLRGDGHREVQQLLPWYVAGGLEPSEIAEVEAHLSRCPECQADVRFEGRLNAEMSTLPVDVEHGWAQMRRRLPIGSAQRNRVWSGLTAAVGAGRAAAPAMGWLLAAPALLLVGVLSLQSLQTARYHALGGAPSNPAGNVVVIFRPDATEKAFRETLLANQARLVDGPTAAGAYVLHVPEAGRDAALARLRKDAGVVLAQPVDSGARP